MWREKEQAGYFFENRLQVYYVWDPRIHAKLYHSAEQNRKLGGFTLSQAKAIQRARKEHENFRAEFESILRGIEGSMEAANLGSRRLTTQELFEALKHAQHPTRRDHRSNVQPEEMVEYQSARYQAAEANILNETESYLNIDGYLYGVVSLKELPDATFPGMLQNFSTLGFPIVVSGQVVIPDQVKVLKSYKKRLQKMTAAQKDANGNFKSNPEAEVAQAQLMQVQRDIISSSLKTAKLSLSVVVRTSHPAVTMRDLEQSERELANRTQEVLNAFTHMNGAKAVAETIAKRRIFLGTLPGLGEADKRDQDMLTSNVADLVPVEMPWMGTRRSPLILFETPYRQLIPFSMFDPDLSDANGLLMAKSGGGKTLAAQQMLLMAARANPLISILERGDSYQPLVELMGGEMIEMSLDSDQTINPWDLPKGEDRPSNDQISFLKNLTRHMLGENTPPDLDIDLLDSVLLEAIGSTYKRCSAKTSNPIPLFGDLAAELAHWQDRDRNQKINAMAQMASTKLRAWVDGVVLFETDKQARQRRLIVMPLFEVLPRLLQGKPRQLFDAAQPVDPVPERPVTMPPEQCPVMCLAFAIIALQRLPDALGQSLLYLREFILTLVFFVVLGGVFVHLLFVHQCVVMVIEAHDLVERVSQRPVECRSQSFGFSFHCFDRRADLQIARSSALDEDS
jgi:hypothetical protein